MGKGKLHNLIFLMLLYMATTITSKERKRHILSPEGFNPWTRKCKGGKSDTCDPTSEWFKSLQAPIRVKQRSSIDPLDIETIRLVGGPFAPEKSPLPLRLVDPRGPDDPSGDYLGSNRFILGTDEFSGNSLDGGDPVVLESSYREPRTLDYEEESPPRGKRRVGETRSSKDGTPFVSPDSQGRSFVKGRKHGGGPNIDSIIQGIMKLLGGNVKITTTESDDPKQVTPGTTVSPYPITSRINNRGPPRLPVVPFGILPSGPPIRPPVTPPSGENDEDPDKPQFVANTRPPFLVPLPPALSARPTATIAKPIVTGIPIPEDVLASIPGASGGHNQQETPPVTAVSPQTTEEEANTIDGPVEEDADSELPPEVDVAPDIPDNETGDPETPMQEGDNSTEAPLTPSEGLPEPPSLPIPKPPTPTLEPSILSSSSVSTTGEEPQSKSTTGTSPLSTGSVRFTPTTALNDVTMTSSTSNGGVTPPLPSVTSVNPRPPIRTPQSGAKFPPQSSQEQQSITIASTGYLPSRGHIPTRLPGPIRPFPTTGHRGVVLEDTPVVPLPGGYKGQLITAASRPSFFGSGPEVFDVTVSALQGYGGPPGRVNALITTSKRPGDGSVFIDGRKTYFDLHPPTAPHQPTPPRTTQVQSLGVGIVIPETVSPESSVPPSGGLTNAPVRPSRPKNPPRPKTPPRPKNPSRPPTLGPPKRIDTCIVGYDTTCKEELGEVCRTEGDVSSCYCRPGTARKRSRTECKKSVQLHLSLKVDRVGQRRIVWGGNYANPAAKEYQVLQYEAEKALDSAFVQSRNMASLYMDSSVNAFYSLGGRVIVNCTVKLLHTPQTASPNIRKSLQRHLIRVIKTNNNFVGDSILAVDGPLNPVPDVSDVNECFDSALYDCHSDAVCSNTFGSYSCVCKKGFTDRYPDDPSKTGRFCDSCSRDFCSKRGDCRIEDGHNVCLCEDSFYGSRCEIDGEVIAVAVGASVAAVVIIILTLIFLCMWSQRWKAQDRKTEILSRFPGGGLFGGWRGRGGGRGDAFSVDMHQKGGGMPPSAPYGATIEDRIRWAQMETLSRQNQNVYAPSTSGDAHSGLSHAHTGLSSTHGESMATTLLRLKALHEEAQKKEGVVDEVLRLFRRRGKDSSKSPLDKLSPAETLKLHQMILLQQAQQQQINTLLNQPEHMRAPFSQDQMKVLPPPADYSSLGGLSPFPQQFGMHHLGPSYLPQTHLHQASRPHSTYGQYGPPSLTSAASGGGVSRAPTLGARTPVPLRDALGHGSMLGPLGGGVATRGNNSDSVGALLTESSEDDQDRPYQLPRPKSRSSVLDDNDDFYYDPDEMMTSSRFPPLPSSPPPQTPHFHFDQFFKSKFP